MSSDEVYKYYLISVIKGEKTDSTKNLFKEDGTPIDAYKHLYNLDDSFKSELISELYGLKTNTELETFAIGLDAMITREVKLNELGI